MTAVATALTPSYNVLPPLAAEHVYTHANLQRGYISTLHVPLTNMSKISDYVSAHLIFLEVMGNGF